MAVTREAFPSDDVTREASPFVDVVADMIATGLGVGDNLPVQRTPVVGSPAHDALQQQDQYAGPWAELPVEGLNAAIVLTLLAAEDSMHAFVALMRAPRPSIYSHYANVRTALECLGKVHHLAQPNVSLPERLRRHLNYLIGEHETRLLLPAGAIDKPATRKRAAEIASAARVLNQSVGPRTHNKIQFIGSSPPGQGALVAKLLDDEESGFGKATYFSLSATAHGGFLNGLLANAEPLTESEAGVHLVGIKRASLDVAQCCAYLILGHHVAYTEYRFWNGYQPHPDRLQVERRAQKALDAVKRSLDARTTGPDGPLC